MSLLSPGRQAFLGPFNAYCRAALFVCRGATSRTPGTTVGEGTASVHVETNLERLVAHGPEDGSRHGVHFGAVVERRHPHGHDKSTARQHLPGLERLHTERSGGAVEMGFVREQWMRGDEQIAGLKMEIGVVEAECFGPVPDDLETCDSVVRADTQHDFDTLTPIESVALAQLNANARDSRRWWRRDGRARTSRFSGRRRRRRGRSNPDARSPGACRRTTVAAANDADRLGTTRWRRRRTSGIRGPKPRAIRRRVARGIAVQRRVGVGHS